MNVAAILCDPAYPSLKARILEETGLDYYADKDEDLAARIGRRIAARKVPNCTAYRALLGSPGVPAEYDQLIGELTIGETYFFRQPEHFDLLRAHIIPEILRRNAESRQIRIWSAGCATGAEPYSVALVLWQEFGALLNGWNVEILGTDINTEFLERAKRAEYGAWALRETPEEVRRRSFEHDSRRKIWKLRRQYAKGVRFQRHNLASSTFFPGEHGDPFDLILCRNVLIYFSMDRVRSLVSRMYESLAPGGWLIVGHAEVSIPELQRFDREQIQGVAVYCKPPAVLASEWAWLPQPPPEKPPAPVRPAQRRHRSSNPPREIPAPAGAVPDLAEARLLAGRGEWTRAEDLCRRLIEAEPLRAAGHFTLGLILEHASAPDAEAAFRRCIYLDRQFALGHYHLGCCLERSGQVRRARKSFENVLEILGDAPGNDPVPDGEGMTGAELKDLIEMHLRALERP